MAIGDAFATKGHVSELQPSAELHKPSFEPKLTRLEKKEQNQKNEHGVCVLSARELAKALGIVTVDFDYDRVIYMEVFPIQTQRCFSCNGLLSSHG